MNALKDPSKVMEEREAQFAMMQEQQMIKQAPALADAVQKVSGAVDPSSIISQVEQGDINFEQ